ncbi:MAG: formylglycine-generating enzyme family protein, partial [Rhodospirillales bacterium]|nr:formylglycine-generating enzyme family protein [Rhodospirillales bacterium]
LRRQPPSPPPPREPAVGTVFRDCEGARVAMAGVSPAPGIFCGPEMVVIPAGSFRMGDLNSGGYDREKPVHRVTIPRPFAVGKYEVTRGEFSAFVNDTGYSAGGDCYYWTGSKVEKSKSRNWRSPGFSQTDRDPVVCVSWDDAKAYVRWLSRKAGKEYRLPSESEWEYMARAGGTAKYPFGDSEGFLCEYGNGADRSTGFEWKNKSCNDGYGEKTAPVGSFKPNNFRVYDTVGNVWEWVEDCWHDSYRGAPSGGDAWTTGGNCRLRVLRGGSWLNPPRILRSAYRNWDSTDFRNYYFGFRIARTL